MCSRATFEAAPAVAEVESARTAIRGKAEEVEVFIVRGLKGEPRDDVWGRRLENEPAEAETLPQGDTAADPDEILALGAGLAALPSPQDD